MKGKIGIIVIAATILLLTLCAAVIMDWEKAKTVERVIAPYAVMETKAVAQPSAEKESVEAPSPPDQTNEFIPLLPEVSIVEGKVPAREVIENVSTGGFILKICNTRITVGFDTTEEALDERPGWLNTSAYPGDQGVCVIYGHRNRRHLRALEKAELGDEITLSTAEGRSFTYTIVDAYVLDDLSELAISPTEQAALVLVTCYPFRYSCSAPQKYVVTAVLKGENLT